MFRSSACNLHAHGADLDLERPCRPCGAANGRAAACVCDSIVGGPVRRIPFDRERHFCSRTHRASGARARASGKCVWCARIKHHAPTHPHTHARAHTHHAPHTHAHTCAGQVHSASQLKVDICVDNSVALSKTKLLAEYVRRDERARALCMCVKYWARLHRLNCPFEHTLSSYAWALLAIHYLVTCRRASQPCSVASTPKLSP